MDNVNWAWGNRALVLLKHTKNNKKLSFQSIDSVFEHAYSHNNRAYTNRVYYRVSA